MKDLGHWTTKLDIPENPYGFIYIITNNSNGRMYVGKKQILTKLKRKPLKGKINRRISIKETDWKTYTGSSKELNEDIKKFGIENFSFEIIKFCENKSQMAYFEAKEQFDREVLIKEEYYNGIINLRLGKIKF
jgi:hypothetical protein